MAKKAVAIVPQPTTYTFPEARLLAARYLPYMRQTTVSMNPTQKKGLLGIGVDSSMRAYYDPDRLNEIPMEEAASEIMVEVFKTFLNHAARARKFLGPNPTKQQLANWMKASNMVVIQIMEDAKLPLPAAAIRVQDYGFDRNKVVEEYCSMLDEQQEDNREDGDGEGEGEGQGSGDGTGTGGDGGGSCGDDQQKPWEDPKDSKDNPGLDEHEQDMLRRITAKAIEDHERASGRGNMPGYLRRAAKEILKPQVDPVRELLAQVKFAVNSTTGHGDYSWKKLNRRQPPGGVRLPAHVQPIPKILVVVDTSGSMGQEDLGLALGVIGQVLKALPSQGVTVVAGDTHMASVGKYFRPDQVELAGGGGTDMARVLTQAANMDRRPDAIIIATDGETGWPAEPIGPRVVAAITRRNSHYPVPEWINVVELNPSEEE